MSPAVSALRAAFAPGRPARRVVLLILMGAAFAAMSLAAVVFTSFGALTAIWPTNALALVAILRGPRDLLWRAGVYVTLWVWITAAVMLAGAPPLGAIGISATNLVEIGTATFLLSRFGLIGKDLTRPRALIGFIACAALIAPALAAALAAPMVAPASQQTFAQAWWDYWAADALGVMIIAPFAMVVTRDRFARVARSGGLLTALGLFTAISLACVLLAPRGGSQIALLAPLAVLATLRFGVLGAVISVLWAAAFSVGLNLMGYGSVAPGPDLRHALFDLQLGLAILPLATLPVAAVLAERNRALKARAAFLTNMSHELRTPLNGIIGMSEILTRTAAADEDRNIARTIQSSGQALERLLSDVLDLARMASGEAVADQSRFDLSTLAEEAVETCARKVADKPVVVHSEIAPGLAVDRLGPERALRKVLVHLLDNAAKMTAAGEIVLRLSEADGRVRLEVSDTGPGFEPGRIEAMLDAFSQADGSLTRQTGGAGLGLTIVRRLVEHMNGRLECEGRPGEGATFAVILPLAVAETAESASTVPETGGERPPRVLMAEDNPANRKVVELILGMAGVDLTSVENGAEAVAAWSAGAYDVVLMDVQMPVMDGLSAVRAIRQREAATGARTPILMLTANAMPEHRAASAAAGADAHLTKPVDAQGLLAALQAALAGAPRPGDVQAA